MSSNNNDDDDIERSSVIRGGHSSRSRPLPQVPAQAYSMPSFFSGRRGDIIVLALGALLVLFFLRNLIFKDYTEETKSYLTSIGKSEAIDKVIPKTRLQLMEEKVCTHLPNTSSFFMFTFVF